MIKYLHLTDIHAGWEFKRVGGKRIVQSTHDEVSIMHALDFAQDFQPDVIVLGGDNANCAPVGHWNERYPGRIGNFTLKDELDLLNDVVLAGLRSKKRVRRIWHRGNHEKWFTDLLDRNPGLEGLTSIEGYLDLERRGWEIYDCGEASEVGKLKFIHGDNVPGGVNIARSAANRYNTNIAFGHFHTYQTYTMFNPLDNSDSRISIARPCLANLGPHYGNNAPNNHLNGWGYGWVDEMTGNFYDHTAIISDGKVFADGKLYE